MIEVLRGQRLKLSGITASPVFEVGVNLSAGVGQVLDISCFGLDANGRLADDRYFVFYNQRSSPCGCLSASASPGPGVQTFRVDLSGLPATIRRMVFVATVDGSGTMRELGASRLDLLVDGRPVSRFGFDGSAFDQERAVMIAEVYHKDEWRFAAVGQGFAGGLGALLAHFGGKELAPARPAPTVGEAASKTPAPASRLSLGKVTLEKRGAKQALSLKKGGVRQPIHINLNWDAPKPKPGLLGFLGGGGSTVDLDLGCMFELADGTKGVIQPLGGNFGAKDAAPWIYLDKDDRSGSANDGENLYLYRPDLIARVAIFALIYEGTAKFSEVNARLVLKDETGSEVTIRLDNADPTMRFCSICTIVRRGEGVEVVKDELYFSSHQAADQHYGFGFRWTAGRK